MGKIKKFINSLPVTRLLIYVIVIGFLPIVFAALHYLQKNKEWETVSDRILDINHFSMTAARKQALNTVVRHVYGDSDQFYLENQLEQLSFLKKEKETLEQLLKSPTFTGNEATEKRYAFLNSALNRFKWIQGSIQVAEGIQETDVILSHPVEVDASDLKEIFTRIEGSRKGKPQLIISDFKLNKKEFINGNEVFELNMKLLKREFIPA